jgi:hypothetical protein
MNLLFDEVTHTYWLDGKKIPSVTEILKDAGWIDTTWYKQSGTDRGTAVHEATEFIDRGDLDVEDFKSEPWYGYIEAYMAFKRETGFEPVYIEEQLAHPEWKYAGTLDRIGKIAGEVILLDIKTGAAANWHGIQLAAYDQAVGSGLYHGPLKNRRVLRLRKNKRYSLDSEGTLGGKKTPFTDPVWDDIWLALAKTSYYDRYFKK